VVITNPRAAVAIRPRARCGGALIRVPRSRPPAATSSRYHLLRLLAALAPILPKRRCRQWSLASLCRRGRPSAYRYRHLALSLGTTRPERADRHSTAIRPFNNTEHYAKNTGLLAERSITVSVPGALLSLRHRDQPDVPVRCRVRDGVSPSAPTPPEALTAIERHCPTVVTNAPTMMQARIPMICRLPRANRGSTSRSATFRRRAPRPRLSCASPSGSRADASITTVRIGRDVSHLRSNRPAISRLLGAS
jgi:hypothetical protein